MEAEEKYLRMTKSERIQHFLLLSSFMVLIVTGFALKFPEAWWVKMISAVIGEYAFEARGIVHRVASVVMIVASIYHLYYISMTQRGRQLVKDFFPSLRDITEFKDSMLYLVGRKSDRPLYGRFSYIEKMEYWAVVWGTVIMGATGFILWFKDFFFRIVGNVGMDIATAIHYYEAILASLAILVWHLYFVFVNPDVRPMNKAWLSGYLTKEEMEKEHPLELQKLAEESAAEEKKMKSEL
jgi:formate dehydrogenase gamma subunit